MKHIQKKYYQEHKNVALEKISYPILDPSDSIDIVEASKEDQLFLIYNDNSIVRAFAHQHKDKILRIPIPDLSIVYFNSAYLLNKLRIEQFDEMVSKVSIDGDKMDENATNEIFKFYGYSSSCLISLFTALESFINHILPDNEVYVYKKKKYNKGEIQRWIPFNDKVKYVLPFYFGKTFFTNATPLYEHIDNLKSIRDELIHTKSDQNLKLQEKLMSKIIDFDYEKAFEASTDFMNFYKKEFIVECHCGRDF